MTKTANRRFIRSDERIHSGTRIEYALILAALAVVVYGVSAPTVSDSSPMQMLREQQSRVSGIQRNPEEERE